MSRQKQLNAAVQQIEEALDEIGMLRDEYEEWRDNMPENLGGSPTYEKLDEAIDTLDNAISEGAGVTSDLEGLDLPLGFGRD